MDVKKAVYLLIALVAAMLISACPSQNGTEIAYTISGKAIDEITGDGVAGATVVFGSYTVDTDASGNYSISVDRSDSPVTGMFAVYKGLEYSFMVFEGQSVDASSNPTYDLYLSPTDDATYSSITLSGQVYDNLGAEIGDDYDVGLLIFNSGGGVNLTVDHTYDKTSGTGYEINTRTYGSDCFVLVIVRDASEDFLFTYYLKNQDLSTSNLNYDLTQPTSGYTDVTITGQQDVDFQATLIVPDFPPVALFWMGMLSGVTQTTVPLYNPDNYPLIWATTAASNDTPGPGDSTAAITTSAVIPFASSVTLPLKSTATGPTEIVDAAHTAVWDGSTLSFAAASGANAYTLFISDDTWGDGLISMDDTEITFPSDFVTSVLEPGTGWDIQVMPAWSSGIFGTDPISTFAGQPQIYSGPVGIPEIEVVYIGPNESGNGSAVDIIP